MIADVRHRWDTRSLPGRNKSEAWEEMLRTTYGACDLALDTHPSFHAEIASRALGDFQITECICDPCGAKRTRSEIARDNRESLTIQLLLSGREHINIGDEWIMLGEGDLLIWSSIEPIAFEVKETLHKISVTVPLASLRSWLPSGWNSIANSLPCHSQGAGLLRPMISSLTPVFLAGKTRNGEALVDAVTGMLVNALEVESVGSPLTLKEAHVSLVKDYINAKLRDPELSPTQIAKAKRISLRYLHALFEGAGITVQKYIIKQRLARCRRELMISVMAGRTITDIAFSWGFQNSTHFSRRFRAEYGISPQEFRSHAMTAGRGTAAAVAALLTS